MTCSPVERPISVLACLLLVVLLAGCGLGAGRSQPGNVQFTITRDYGAHTLDRFTQARVGTDDTVMRLLRRHTKVKMAYGGRFVNSIDGLGSAYTGLRRDRRDWFFYVNGIESGEGAAEARVYPGDRVWWDYHEWGAVQRVPALVGAYPQPFESGSEGKRFAVRLDCGAASRAACRTVEGRLAKLNVSVGKTEAGASPVKDAIRVVIGTWGEVKDDPAAAQVGHGPKQSGVFVRVSRSGHRTVFDLLSAGGSEAIRAGPGSGLVAATRVGDAQPVWLIIGADREGLKRATHALSASSLRNSFALAVTRRRGGISLPLRDRVVRR